MTPRQIMEDVDTFLLSTDERRGFGAFVMNCVDEEEFGCSDCSKNVFIPKNEYEQKCDGVKCNVNFVNQNGHGIDTKFV